MTILLSLLTPLPYQAAIIFGFITFAPFGFLSVTSKRKMALLASKGLRILKRSGSNMSVLLARKTNAGQQ